MLLILCLMILGVGGESIHGISRERIIKKERIPQDLPELSEWNYENPEFRRRLIVQGGKPNHRMFNTQSSSEVGGMLAEVCRQCMVTMDIDCISSLCMLQKQRIEVDISPVPGGEIATQDVEHHAFATGTSLHADILCSLCKHTRDVMCTMKLCENPDRDKYVKDGGVECQQGFCRWQKDTVSVSGYSNYYQGWWQPQESDDVEGTFTPSKRCSMVAWIVISVVAYIAWLYQSNYTGYQY